MSIAFGAYALQLAGEMLLRVQQWLEDAGGKSSSSAEGANSVKGCSRGVLCDGAVGMSSQAVEEAPAHLLQRVGRLVTGPCTTLARRSAGTAILIAGMFQCGIAEASGFQLFEQTVSSVATAGADQAATGDATTALYNPAAMAWLRGTHLSLVTSVIKPTGHFSVSEARSAAQVIGAGLAGGSGGDPGSYNVLPSLFYVHALNDQAAFGLSMTSTFGLSTHYDNGWVGRYHALDSKFATYEITPELAIALDDKLAVALGLSAQYARAELSNAIDFGGVCLGLAAQEPGFGAVCAASGMAVPGQLISDGLFRVKGTSWAYGWNAAVSYLAAPGLEFGAAYRSHVQHNLKATTTFDKPASLPGVIAAQAAFSNGDASAKIELPESVTVATKIGGLKEWTFMAALTWTRWSRFRDIAIRFDNGTADTALLERWHDTVRAAIGASYRYDARWSWHVGLAYDPTAIPDVYRGPRIPEQTRTIVAFGGEYAASKNDTIGLGYQHQFQRRVSLDLNDPIAGRLAGTYERPYIDVVAIQYNHTF